MFYIYFEFYYLSAMEKGEKEYLTTEEAYNLLGISRTLFYQIKDKNNLQSYTLIGASGKKNLFKRVDILGLVISKSK